MSTISTPGASGPPPRKSPRALVILANGIMAGAAATYVATGSIAVTALAGGLGLAGMWAFLKMSR